MNLKKMKFQSSEVPIGNPHQPRKRTSKLAPLVALMILLTIPLYYPTIRDYSSNKLPDTLYEHTLDQPIKLETPPTSFEPAEKTNNDDDDITILSETVDKTNHGDDDIKISSETAEKTNHDDDDIPILSETSEKTNHDDDIPISSETGEKIEEKNNNDKGNAAAAANQHPSQRTTRKKHARVGRRKRPTTTTRNREEKSRKNTIIGTNNNNNNEVNDQLVRPSDEGKRVMRSRVVDDGKCDLFSGEWVPNPEGPYYTNDTCGAIQEHQNCLKFGRPDRDFLRWRWKPEGCEMPVFEPTRFLELVRRRSIAFVGDSVARNHMQSLICLLSRVADPVDLSGPLDQNKRYEYKAHDFNISMFWAPYLVRTEKTDPDDEKRPFNLYLDEFDDHWTTQIALFDYVIISAGHWFFRPTYFYVDRRLTGCLYCPEPDVTHHTTSYFSYRRAFRTAFRAINASGFGGVAFLRTFAPSHFEGAAWDRGGDCQRTGPYGRNEVVLEDYSLEMYLIQLEELRIAQRAAGNGGKFRLFDATRAMLLRPDGHPSKYGHWQGANQSFANDCVHWCLPGPIDSWNDFLQELLSRETTI